MMRKVTYWTAALAALGLLFAAPVARAQEKAILPFNGTDLKGWKLKGNEAKSKWVVGRAGLDVKSPNKLAVTVLKPGQEGGPGGGNWSTPVPGWTFSPSRSLAMGFSRSNSWCPKSRTRAFTSWANTRFRFWTVLAARGGSGIWAASIKWPRPRQRGQGARRMAEVRHRLSVPRFKGGKKVSNAKFLKITLNDQVIHENVEMVKGPTPGGLTGKERRRDRSCSKAITVPSLFG